MDNIYNIYGYHLCTVDWGIPLYHQCTIDSHGFHDGVLWQACSPEVPKLRERVHTLESCQQTMGDCLKARVS